MKRNQLRNHFKFRLLISLSALRILNFWDFRAGHEVHGQRRWFGKAHAVMRPPKRFRCLAMRSSLDGFRNSCGRDATAKVSNAICRI